MEEKVKKLEDWQNKQSSRCSAREIRAIQLETAMCEIKKDIEEIKINQHEYMAEMTKFREELFDKLEKRYVSKDEFKPVKGVVYGMVGFIMLAFLGAIISLVLTRQVGG